MECTVTWTGATGARSGMGFLAETGSGHVLVMDGAPDEARPENGGRNLAPRPMETVLAGTGGLHAVLFQMTTEAPTPARRRALDEVLRGAVERHFKTWTASPEVQREGIERHEWRGRYVGFWHLHPPRITAGGYASGLEPSTEDLAIAVEQGQLLTLVFQPDGFDAYDLAPVSASGGCSPRFRRRSARARRSCSSATTARPIRS